MYDFAYHKPTSLAEAVRLLKADPDAKPLAGGHTLIPALKHRLNRPSALVDLSGIAELRGIRREGDTVVIGAMTRHVELATDPIITAAIPALARMAGSIGDVQVRNRGTMGGSLANNDPAADYPAAVLALGGTLVTDAREIPAGDCVLRVRHGARSRGPLLVAIRPAGAGEMRLRQDERTPPAAIPWPAYVAMRARGGAGGGEWRRPRRVPGGGDGTGAGWRTGRPRAVAGITIPAEGPDSRHPRLGRVPRPSGDGDGQAGGDRRRLDSAAAAARAGATPRGGRRDGARRVQQERCGHRPHRASAPGRATWRGGGGACRNGSTTPRTARQRGMPPIPGPSRPCRRRAGVTPPSRLSAALSFFGPQPAMRWPRRPSILSGRGSVWIGETSEATRQRHLADRGRGERVQFPQRVFGFVLGPDGQDVFFHAWP